MSEPVILATRTTHIGQGTIVSANHTVDAGTEALIVAAAFNPTTSDPPGIDTCEFDGDPLMLEAKELRLHWFYMLNPTPKTALLRLQNNVSSVMYFAAFNVKDVDLTDLFGIAASASFGAGQVNISVNVPSAGEDEIVTDVFWVGQLGFQSPATPGSNQTDFGQGEVNNNRCGASFKSATQAGTTPMSWTLANAQFGSNIAGIAINGKATPISQPQEHTLRSRTIGQEKLRSRTIKEGTLRGKEV